MVYLFSHASKLSLDCTELTQRVNYTVQTKVSSLLSFTAEPQSKVLKAPAPPGVCTKIMEGGWELKAA
ncbi:hypothetical protein ACRRTK_025082 [Alexandromys fortis]